MKHRVYGKYRETDSADQLVRCTVAPLAQHIVHHRAIKTCLSKVFRNLIIRVPVNASQMIQTNPGAICVSSFVFLILIKLCHLDSL